MMLMPHQYHEQCRVLVTSNFDVSECELLFHFHYHIFKQRGLWHSFSYLKLIKSNYKNRQGLQETDTVCRCSETKDDCVSAGLACDNNTNLC